MLFSAGVSNGAVISVTPETNVLQESLLGAGILSKGICSRGGVYTSPVNLNTSLAIVISDVVI